MKLVYNDGQCILRKKGMLKESIIKSEICNLQMLVHCIKEAVFIANNKPNVRVRRKGTRNVLEKYLLADTYVKEQHNLGKLIHIVYQPSTES